MSKLYQNDKVIATGLSKRSFIKRINVGKVIHMAIKDVRREVLRRYRDSLDGVDTELSEKLDRSLSQINQIIGPNPTRGIGDKLAADIEKRLGKPSGWLDRIDEPAQKVREPQAEYKTSLKNDAMLKTLLHCYHGLSDAHKDVLAMLANKLYIIDNPDSPGVAQPFIMKKSDHKSESKQ